MKFMKAIAGAVLALALPLATGCGVEGASPESEAGNEGLVLAEHTAERVAGTFEREGHRLSFELRRGADVLEARISDAEGPLLVSTLRDGVEDVEYLGGRARVQGTAGGGMPKLEGHTKIFDALNARPAAALIFELKDTLRAAGVERGFLSAESGKQQMDVRSSSWTDGVYTYIPYTDIHDFATWGWTTYTTFELSAASAPTTAKLLDLTGSARPEYTSVIYPGSPYYRRLQYWGALVRIENTRAPCSGCDTTLRVRSW